jgi:hypothetical protein
LVAGSRVGALMLTPMTMPGGSGQSVELRMPPFCGACAASGWAASTMPAANAMDFQIRDMPDPRSVFPRE